MLHQGCIFCTPTAPQMEATAVRESHIAAAGFHGDCMCGAAMLWMSAELGRGEGVQKLLLLLLVALRLLRS